MTKAAVIKVTDEDLQEMRRLREAEFKARLRFLWKKYAYLLKPKLRGHSE
jgi:hypothetical protein